MAIFDSLNLTPVDRAAAALKNRMVMSVTQFVKQYQNAFDAIWNRTDGIEPQAILDAFGTDAAELFSKSAATRDYILALDANLLPEAYRAPPLPVTINSDGTVSVGSP